VLNNEKWALVTGASGGIGKDIAELFADEGINLVITARSKKLLEEIQSKFEQTNKIKVEVIDLDLCKPDSASKLYEIIKNKLININYLVNNAGFGDYGDFVKSDLSIYEKMINLNILALTQLSHLFAKDMCIRKEGKIMNVASTAAFQPIPGLNVYSSTKSYVLNFSEALSRELKGSGVTVTVLCPGGTKTNFHNAAGFKSNKERKGYLMDSKKVAKIGYQAMMKGKRLVVAGFFNKILAFSVRFTPRAMVILLSRKIMESTQK
jgi:hypothetical protein